MSSVTCEVFPPWPSSMPCSNHGTCISNNTCSCIAGWASTGDFAVVPDLDCDINILAVRVLWILPLVMNVGLVLASIRYLFGQRRLAKEQAATAIASGKRVPNFSFLEPRHIFVYNLLCTSVSLICMACLKISDTTSTRIVGGNAAVTAALGSCFFWFWGSESVYLYMFTELVVKQARLKANSDRIRTQLAQLKYTLAVLHCLNMVWALIPFGMLTFPGSQYVFSALHYMGASTNISILAFIVTPRSLGVIRKDILDTLKSRQSTALTPSSPAHSSSSNAGTSTTSSRALAKEDDHQRSNIQAMEEAEKKIGFVQKQITQSGINELVLAIVFGMWPFMTRKASYQLPASYFMGSMLLAMELYTIIHSRSSKSGTAGASPGKSPQQVVASTNTDDSSLKHQSTSNNNRSEKFTGTHPGDILNATSIRGLASAPPSSSAEY